jgi:hypothetical protein
MGSFSVWHWLVLAAIVALIGAPLYWLIRSNRSHAVGLDTLAFPSGFSGWLLLLAFGVYLSPLRSIVNLLNVDQGVDETTRSQLYLAFDGEMALQVVLLIMQVTTAIFMFRRSRRFMSMFVLTGIYIFILTPLDLFWVSEVASSQTGQSFGSLLEKVATPEAIGNWIGVSILVAVWMLYVTRSRRVANTFTR